MLDNQPYVRLATRDDFEDLVILARRAFLHGPLVNYMANLEKPLDDNPSIQRDNVETFLRSLLGVAFSSQRRITVVVIPGPSEHGGKAHERLVAWAIWVPPHAPPPQGLTVPTVWGQQGIEIYTGEYWRQADEVQEKTFAKRCDGVTAQSVWHLAMVGVDPSEQGKGHLSRLAHEAFAHAPGASFALEANSKKAADRYEHLGFKHELTFVVGKGKVDSFGYRAATAEDATGITFYVMVKWADDLPQ